jgi:Ca2+-binding EF-hand superfamily protein
MTTRISSTGFGFAGIAAALVIFGAAPASAQSNEKLTKEQAVQAVFQRFDGNKDGNITSAEFLKTGKRDFQALDLDKDGSVSKQEFSDPKPRQLSKLSGDQLAKAKEFWSKQFDLLDTDKNGLLSPAEHEKAGKRSFARIDTNKDNEITLPELTAAAK